MGRLLHGNVGLKVGAGGTARHGYNPPRSASLPQHFATNRGTPDHAHYPPPRIRRGPSNPQPPEPVPPPARPPLCAGNHAHRRRDRGAGPPGRRHGDGLFRSQGDRQAPCRRPLGSCLPGLARRRSRGRLPCRAFRITRRWSSTRYPQPKTWPAWRSPPSIRSIATATAIICGWSGSAVRNPQLLGRRPSRRSGLSYPPMPCRPAESSHKGECKRTIVS
jgi:hypothetical protein